MTLLKNALEMNHFILQHHIKLNDTVVDATMGNGNDTLLLAKLVGENGVVHAFDIQKAAINNTTQLLENANCLKQCQLHHIGHEHLNDKLDNNIRLSAATFNLGYLPNGDKTITTNPNNTIEAIKNILPKLASNGIITIVAYHGHDMGKIEKNNVEVFLKSLLQTEFTVAKYEFLNQVNTPPVLFVIERR